MHSPRCPHSANGITPSIVWHFHIDGVRVPRSISSINDDPHQTKTKGCLLSLSLFLSFSQSGKAFIPNAKRKRANGFVTRKTHQYTGKSRAYAQTRTRRLRCVYSAPRRTLAACAVRFRCGEHYTAERAAHRTQHTAHNTHGRS